jgi:hypothetical protein
MRDSIATVGSKKSHPPSREPLRELNGKLGSDEVLVGRAGFEPATNGLKVRCSTD